MIDFFGIFMVKQNPFLIPGKNSMNWVCSNIMLGFFGRDGLKFFSNQIFYPGIFTQTIPGK